MSNELAVIPVERIEEVLPEAVNQNIPTAPPAEADEPLATSTAS